MSVKPFDFQSFFEGSLRESPGEIARNKAYAKLLKEDYRWDTNCHKDDAPAYRARYEAKDLEVFVHPQAFAQDGIQWADGKAILTRKRK